MTFTQRQTWSPEPSPAGCSASPHVGHWAMSCLPPPKTPQPYPRSQRIKWPPRGIRTLHWLTDPASSNCAQGRPTLGSIQPPLSPKGAADVPLVCVLIHHPKVKGVQSFHCGESKTLPSHCCFWLPQNASPGQLLGQGSIIRNWTKVWGKKRFSCNADTKIKME